MTENQRREEDVLTARDLVIRAVTALGLVGGALVALLTLPFH